MAEAIVTTLRIMANVDVTVVIPMQGGSGECRSGHAVMPMSLSFAPTNSATSVLIDLTSCELKTEPAETDSEAIKSWWRQYMAPVR